MTGGGRARADGDAAVAIAGDAYGPISTTYIATQVLTGGAVPVSAAVMDPSDVFAAAGIGSFTGREWLTTAVDQFMTGARCGYVLVEAGAGLGKTAFAAWMVRERGYLSHFSRYSEGGSARGALRNLAGQLIRDMGGAGGEFAGLVPEWAQYPAGFQNLLARAAAATREGGSRLVIVADGMDEAERPDGALAFGLPVVLPAGVFVIGTHRTGYSPGRPDCPSVKLRIDSGDQRNLDDITAFLAAATRERVLAARLAAARMDPDGFTGLLASRCGGVWVYLRYVLEELRLGLRQPGEISSLPGGLRGYYADQIDRWRRDPAWETELLPLLATLAVTAEPLAQDALARLAGISNQAARRILDRTFRPLLATAADSSGERGYEIYHASLREFASHDVVGEEEAESYDMVAMAAELAHAATAAHTRIAYHYLDIFGGLPDGLPALAADPALARADAGYPLRHLARHLEHAGRADDLHGLLTAGHASGSGMANTWYAAHDLADKIGPYADDLNRARRIAAVSADRDIASGRHAPALGTELRYALMLASLTTRADSIPVALLDRLLETGIWSIRRGLDHARRVSDPDERAWAITIVLARADDKSKPRIAAEALAAAAAISGGLAGAKALVTLAPHLPEPMLEQALGVAAATSDDYWRARALMMLVPHLPGARRATVVEQALAAATGLSSERSRAEALGALAPHLPEARRSTVMEQALAAATAISDELARAKALVTLAPHLPEPMLEQALAAAAALSSEIGRAETLGALGKRLPEPRRTAVLQQALATALSWKLHQADALRALAPHLSEPMLEQALADAIVVDPAAWDRARIVGPSLEALAPYLPASVLEDALAAAAAISWSKEGAAALVALAPRLPEPRRAEAAEQALAAVTASCWDNDLAYALDALAPHLSKPRLDGALADAITATIHHEGSRATVLGTLAPHLPEALLEQALATATTISDENQRARALGGLAPHLPEPLLTRALSATVGSWDQVQAEVLGALAPHLPEPRRTAVLEQALAAAVAISSDHTRARALGALAPHLPEPLLGKAVDAAAAISYKNNRARALGELAPHLPEPRRSALIAEALRAAVATFNTSSGAETLGVLVPHLPEPYRTRILAKVLPAAISIDATSSTSHLKALAPHLPAPLLEQALTDASTLRSEGRRVEALAALAPQLPEPRRTAVLEEALTAAIAISSDYTREKALAELAPHLAGPLLEQAITAATNLTGEHSRAEILGALAPHLTEPRRTALLENALTVAIGGRRGRLRQLQRLGVRDLAKLAPHLPAPLLEKALATGPSASGARAALARRAEILIPAQGVSWFVGFLRGCLSGAGRDACLAVISEAASQVAEIGGAEAVWECVQAVDDVLHWWP
jgi:hypothetical protein